MVTVWSGREAHALRAAMRMSIYDFAAHARVSPRSVAKWSTRGSALRLRWDVQRKLDEVLAGAGADVRGRLALLLSEPAQTSPSSDATGTHPPEPDAAQLVAILVHPPEPTGSFVPPALIHLERAVARMRAGYQACRHGQTLAELPALLRLLLDARASSAVRFPTRVRKLAAEAYHVTAGLLLKLDDLPLAMLAAQTCCREADASGEPLAVAAGQRGTARVLMRSGHPAGAAVVARRAAGEVAAQTHLDGPRPLSAYGALLLRATLAHAQAGDGARAMDCLAEAQDTARSLGSDGNFGWTAFGPTNVSLHRVSALLALGDPAGALQVAKGIHAASIRQQERQAAYYVDSARALAQLGRPRMAAHVLRRAADIAPEELAMHASARRLAQELKLPGSSL